MGKPKTRGNGSGSITHINDGRAKPYIVFQPATYSVDSDGKLHKSQKRLGSFKTRKEAENCLAVFNMSSVEKLEYYKGVKTLEEVYNEWYSHTTTIDPNKNMRNYSKCWKKVEILKDYKISDITYNQLQNIINVVTPTMGLQTKTLINALYKFAIKNNYVEKNIGELLETKKIESVKHKETFSLKDIERIKEYLYTDNNSRYARAILVLLYSGMRINELVEMKIENVDLNKNIMIGGSKTTAGKGRIIPIHHEIKKIIQYYMSISVNEYLISGDFPKCNVNSSISAINQFLTKIGMPYSTHSCRASFMTQAYKQKLDWLLIEKVVGHAVRNTGLEFYVSISKEDLIKEVNKLDYSVVAK